MVGNDRDKQKDRETSMGPGAHTLQRNPQAAAAPEELRLGRTRVLSFWFSSISLSSCISHSMEGGGLLSFSQGGRCGESGRKLCSKRQQLLHSWSAPSYGQGSQWHLAWVEETSAKPRQKRFQKVSSCWRYTKMLAPKTMVPQSRGPLLS